MELPGSGADSSGADSSGPGRVSPEPQNTPSTGHFWNFFFSAVALEYPAHGPGKFMVTQRLTEDPGQDFWGNSGKGKELRSISDLRFTWYMRQAKQKQEQKSLCSQQSIF